MQALSHFVPEKPSKSEKRRSMALAQAQAQQQPQVSISMSPPQPAQGVGWTLCQSICSRDIDGQLMESEHISELSQESFASAPVATMSAA